MAAILFPWVAHFHLQITGGGASYHYLDESPLNMVNFYRIKAISITGQINYSDIVKVESINMPSDILVYPNPAKDKVIRIVFKNQKKGTYIIGLSNNLGQIIYQNSVNIDEIQVDQIIVPGNAMASGFYQLSITKEDRSTIRKRVIVE